MTRVSQLASVYLGYSLLGNPDSIERSANIPRDQANRAASPGESPISSPPEFRVGLFGSGFS